MTEMLELLTDALMQPSETVNCTSEWLIEILASKDDEYKRRYGNARPLKIEYEEIGKSIGHTSRIIKANIYFAEDPICHTIILKLPCGNILGQFISTGKGGEANMDKVMTTLRRLHNRECAFYEHVARPSTISTPKAFALRTMSSKFDGAIIMEYLPTEITTQLETHISFNEKQILSIAKEISKLVAVSLMLDESVMKQWTPCGRHYSSPAFDKTVAEKIAAKNPKRFEEMLQRISHLYEDQFLIFLEEKIHEEIGTRPVISHGDMYANNILWRRLEDGSCSDELYAIFDWQTMHCANIARDLAQVLVISTDAEIRRKLEVNIWKILYSFLQEELNKKGVEVPFTVEQMKACYKREFIRQTLRFFFYHEALCPEAEANDEAKERIQIRTEKALEDAIWILENELPQWLTEGHNPLSSLRTRE